VHVARMGQGRGVHRVLVGKPEGKRLMGRPRSRWEDNIKMDFQEVGGGCGDWMEFAQDRDRWRALVSTVINLRVPKMPGMSWLAVEPVSFSRRILLHGVYFPFREVIIKRIATVIDLALECANWTRQKF